MESAVLMTGIDNYMNENFIVRAFQLSGFNVTKVKISPGSSECLVQMPNINACHEAVRTLNNKIIPCSTPAMRFKLKYQYYGRADEKRRPKPYSQGTAQNRHDDDLSLFVTSLSDDVTSDHLYHGFSSRYTSVVSAKVLYHSDGRSKNCGFIRFNNPYDVQRALIEMQHMSGIGKNPIKVRLASKNVRSDASSWSPSMNPYYPYQNYQNYWQAPQPVLPADTYYTYPLVSPAVDVNAYPYTVNEEDLLEEPVMEDDVERVNDCLMEQSEELYTALENSHWLTLQDDLIDDWLH